ACISILFDAYRHASRIVSAKGGDRDHDTRGRCRRDGIYRARAPAHLVPSSVRLVDGGDVVGHDVEKAAGAGAPVERRNYAALPGDVAGGRRCLSGAARRGRGRTWGGTDRRGRSGDRSLRGLSTAGRISAGAMVSGNSSDPGRPRLRPGGGGA